MNYRLVFSDRNTRQGGGLNDLKDRFVGFNPKVYTFKITINRIGYHDPKLG